MSETVSGKEQIAKVAAISAGDEQVGDNGSRRNGKGFQ